MLRSRIGLLYRVTQCLLEGKTLLCRDLDGELDAEELVARGIRPGNITYNGPRESGGNGHGRATIMEADLDGAGGRCTEKRGGGSKRDEIVGDLGCDGAIVDLHGSHVLESQVGRGACLEGGGEGEIGNLEDRRALAAVTYGGEDTGDETEDK